MGPFTFLNGMLLALIFAFVAVISVNIIAALFRLVLAAYAKARKLQL